MRRTVLLCTAILLATPGLLAGSASATATSSWSEDFDSRTDLDGFTSAGGTWSLSAGTLVGQGAVQQSCYDWWFGYYDCSWTQEATLYENTLLAARPIRVDLDLAFDSPSTVGMHGGIILSSTQAPRFGGAEGYAVDYHEGGQVYRLYKLASGQETDLAVVSAPLPQGMHHWTLVVDDATITFFVDGAKVIQADDATETGPWYLGFWTYIGGQMSFDNVAVNAYAPPVVAVPPTLTQEATSANGAIVEFEAGAVDSQRASLPIECVPASGSQFAIGSTVVTCSASDGASASNSSFLVNVVDTVAPAVSRVTDILAEATSADGATVTYAAPTWTDAVDGAGTATCAPESGTTFHFRDTTVQCSHTDAAGNIGTTRFRVRVIDHTAPTFAGIHDIIAAAAGPDGAIVTYSPNATDVVDGARDVTCLPTSGSMFAVGDTDVTCNASDTRGNTAQATFTVSVRVTPPAAPSNLTAATSTLPGEIQLGWDAPAWNGGADVTEYRVYRLGATGEELVGTTTNMSFVATNNSAGASHFFVVRAVNAVGEGAASDAAHAIGTGVPTTQARVIVKQNDAGSTQAYFDADGDGQQDPGENDLVPAGVPTIG